MSRAPATAACFWAAEVWSLAVVAGVVAAFSGFIGLLLSYHAQWPSGPAIVLVAGMAHLFSVVAGLLGGVLWRYRRRPHRKA